MNRPQRLKEIWVWSKSLLYGLQQNSSRKTLAVCHIGAANCFYFQATHLGQIELFANRAGDCRFCVGNKEG